MCFSLATIRRYRARSRPAVCLGLAVSPPPPQSTSLDGRENEENLVRNESAAAAAATQQGCSPVAGVA
uniref:Putative secreted protein n=1 Tax=Anopheles triannulatus TaxID=58253 RepID=A0A2M4B6H1_9DIPT